MSEFYTGAGATISLVSNAPATYNQAGYEVLSFTSVGKVTNFGDAPVKIFEMIELAFLASRGVAMAKGGFKLSPQTITVAIDPADAGQTLLGAANDSDALYSVKLAHPYLGTIYARALVQAGAKTYGDNNTPATQTITFNYSVASATEVGLVYVGP